MSSDPVERATDESSDLYEVTSWEPRSLLDRAARKVYWGVKYAVRWLPIIVSGLLLYYQFRGSQVIDPTVRLLIALSVLPAFVLVAFIWFSDVTSNEPLGLLLATFLLAIVLGPFAGVLNLLVPFAVLLLLAALFGAFFGSVPDVIATVRAGDVPTLTVLADHPILSAVGRDVAAVGTSLGSLPVLRTVTGVAQFGVGLVGLQAIVLALYFFLVVGPVEESVKLLAVRLHAFRSNDFDAVIDGTVYGAVAGLGFATVENALYITQTLQAGTESAVFGDLPFVPAIAAVRALAGPGHVIYSALAGYYLGLAKFNSDHSGPIIVKGLMIATICHGSYNLLVGFVPGILAALSPAISVEIALVTFILAFDGLIGYVLYRKISRYRRVYHTVAPDDPTGRDLEVDVAEFEPDSQQRPPGRQ